MVNGKLLLSAQFRRLGRYVEWNVTPWVDAGKTARVELWGSTLPLYRRNAGGSYDPKRLPPDVKMDMLSARIGCVP